MARRVQPRVRRHAVGSARALRSHLRGVVTAPTAKGRAAIVRSTIGRYCLDVPPAAAQGRDFQRRRTRRMLGRQRARRSAAHSVVDDRSTPVSPASRSATNSAKGHNSARTGCRLHATYRFVPDGSTGAPRIRRSSRPRRCWISTGDPSGATAACCQVPPDRRGQLAAPDVTALAGFRRALDATYGPSLMAGTKVTASSERPDASASTVLDEDADSYWAPSAALPATLTLELARATTSTASSCRRPSRWPARRRLHRRGRHHRRLAAYRHGHDHRSQANDSRALTTATAIRLTIVESRDAPAIARIALARTASPSS